MVLPALAVCLAAILPYLSTIDDYFVRDDFGVVQLLAQKPASYFPRWFVSSWMDEIWGFIPDEVRPFPALSYQVTALGSAASPVLHHALNILIHAANGLLVVAIARMVASLSLPSAAFAGLVFVLLPVHTESVAWITGRVDSMPALFYLASFLAYAIWRQRGSSSSSFLYVGSLAFFFLALFSKQNAVTMVATLAAFDVVVRRQPPLPFLSFIRPYVEYAAMTAGYLWLRYLLFGQVAREGALTARGLEDFRVVVSRHLRHVITGEVDGSSIVLWLALAAPLMIWLIAGLARKKSDATPRQARSLLYFGPVWWVIGVAPIAVAGYASPRHVYLAAVGWAVVLGIVFEIIWTARPTLAWRRATWAAACAVLLSYAGLLYSSVLEWNRIASVSQQALRDVRSAALAAPEGSLLIIGAPVRSWEWALPFAVRPPFERTDLTRRVFIISPRALSCCSPQWFEQTRQTLHDWSAGGGRNSAVALRWDPESGALSRATDVDTPQLPVLTRALLDMGQPEDLDKNLRRMLDVLPVAGR